MNIDKYQIAAGFNDRVTVMPGEFAGMVFCPPKLSSIAVMKCGENQERIHCGIGCPNRASARDLARVEDAFHRTVESGEIHSAKRQRPGGKCERCGRPKRMAKPGLCRKCGSRQAWKKLHARNFSPSLKSSSSPSGRG